MDKLHAQIKNEDQRGSELFKQLFLFQTQLEEYDDEGFQYQSEIRKLINEIDELIGLLIDETEASP